MYRRIPSSLFALLLAAGCGSDGNSEDTVCGGLRGLACSADEYCRIDDGSCGAADQTGICVEKPQICTQIFAPVCGCDGKTYASECNAAAAGVSIVSSESCPEPPQ